MAEKKESIIQDCKRAFFVSCTYGVVFIILAVATLVSAEYYYEWQRHKFDAYITSSIDDNTVETQAKERFYLIVPNRTAYFYINVSTTNNESYLMGMFELDYVHKENLNDGQTTVDVIYKLPDEWIIKTSKDTNIIFEEKYRNPPKQKEIRLDPTFIRGLDYPESIPFDEIEITTDFVSRYIDTNETEYNFIIRVLEENDNFNIKSVTLMTPIGYEVRVG